MIRVYLDSSALIKRVLREAESDALVDALDEHVRDRSVLVSSTLTWIEVARALRARTDAPAVEALRAADAALSGVAEQLLNPSIASMARRLTPQVLRSLDAIHLASALFQHADLMMTYDDRLATACEANGVPVAAPGRPTERTTTVEVR